MSALGKRAPVFLFALLLLGTAIHFRIKERLEQRFSSEAAERRRQLTDLRTDNRRLLKLSRQITTPAETPASPEMAATVRQMKAATELLKTGLFGPFAWTRGQNNSIEDEVSTLADALGLSETQKVAMRSAAAKGQSAVVAAVLASAKVQLNENSVRGAAETREEAEERSRLMDDASPLEQMGMSARMLSKQASSRGEREVSIEIHESPEARAAFDAMQSSFAQIMGPDIYAFYESAGASQMIEGMFNERGLQPHWLSLISRPAGSTSASDEFFRSFTVTPPASPQGVVYEFRRIRSVVTMPQSAVRSANGRGARAGGGGYDPLSGIIPSRGVSWSSQAITGDALRNAMGPLQSLIPPGF